MITFPDILCNAFNQDYTTTQAYDDLHRLMNEATMMQIEGKTDQPRYEELERIIPVQERLAKAKLDGHPIFDQLGSLRLTLPDEEE